MSVKRRKIRLPNLKTRRRLKKYKGMESPEIKLQRFWHQNKKKLKIKTLLYIVRNAEYDVLRRNALIEFLSRENLNFDNFYRMINLSKDILEKDKNLRKEFLKQCFDICTMDNLVELGEAGEPEAITELLRRIENKSTSNRKALQALIRFFERVTDEKVRTILWEKIKKLDPNEEDLKYILDLRSMYALPKIVSDIQKLLRKKEKRTDGRILQKIERFINQIEKGQK